MKRLILSMAIVLTTFSLCFAQTRETIRVSEDISLVKLTDKVYQHISSFQTKEWGKVKANGLLLIDKGKALMLDTPWNNEQTEKLYTWLADSMNVKVTAIIPNHWHGDCMGGLTYLHSQGVKSYANQMTIDIAREKGLPVPQQGFKDTLTVQLNDIDVLCYYPGGGHATDNIVVYIPSEKLLFPGCFSKDIKSKNLGNVVDGDVNTWPKAIDKVLTKFPDAQIVVPGHGNPGGLELLVHTKQLLMEK